jgi:hypothetical protein
MAFDNSDSLINIYLYSIHNFIYLSNMDCPMESSRSAHLPKFRDLLFIILFVLILPLVAPEGNVYTPGPAQLDQGYAQRINIGDSLRIKIGSVDNYFVVEKIDKAVSINWTSLSITTTLKPGEEVSYDLGGGSRLSFRLGAINSSKADLTVKMTAPIAQPSDQPPNNRTKVIATVLILTAALISLPVILLIINSMHIIRARRKAEQKAKELHAAERPKVIGAGSLPPTLLEYVSKAQAKGMPERQIIQKLLKSGWKMKDIEQAYRFLNR